MEMIVSLLFFLIYTAVLVVLQIAMYKELFGKCNEEEQKQMVRKINEHYNQDNDQFFI